MCGIVGYVGPREARPLLLAGLEKLEYRGYDSAGISVIDDGHIEAEKHFYDNAVLRTSDAERSEDASVTQHPHVPPLRKDRLPR